MLNQWYQQMAMTHVSSVQFTNLFIIYYETRTKVHEKSEKEKKKNTKKHRP